MYQKQNKHKKTKNKNMCKGNPSNRSVSTQAVLVNRGGNIKDGSLGPTNSFTLNNSNNNSSYNHSQQQQQQQSNNNNNSNLSNLSNNNNNHMKSPPINSVQKQTVSKRQLSNIKNFPPPQSPLSMASANNETQFEVLNNENSKDNTNVIDSSKSVPGIHKQPQTTVRQRSHSFGLFFLHLFLHLFAFLFLFFCVCFQKQKIEKIGKKKKNRKKSYFFKDRNREFKQIKDK